MYCAEKKLTMIGSFFPKMVLYPFTDFSISFTGCEPQFNTDTTKFWISLLI
jgi:hypothetical protein